MNKFKVGDKVKCIRNRDTNPHLGLGEIYTVKKKDFEGDFYFIILEENADESPVFSDRFELVKEAPPRKIQVDLIKEKIETLNLELAEAQLHQDDMNNEANYNETLHKMRLSLGRKKFIEEENNWSLYIYKNEIRVDSSTTIQMGVFGIYFKYKSDVVNMIKSIGEDNIVSAIDYQMNIGLTK